VRDGFISIKHIGFFLIIGRKLLDEKTRQSQAQLFELPIIYLRARLTDAQTAGIAGNAACAPQALLPTYAPNYAWT
jgi:hypothetical protein